MVKMPPSSKRSKKFGEERKPLRSVDLHLSKDTSLMRGSFIRVEFISYLKCHTYRMVKIFLTNWHDKLNETF